MLRRSAPNYQSWDRTGRSNLDKGTGYGGRGVDVRIDAFEKASLPKNWFDLAIGNVPLGNYKVADASHRAYARFSIHNDFFGRALDLVRPGGPDEARLVTHPVTQYCCDWVAFHDTRRPLALRKLLA